MEKLSIYRPWTSYVHICIYEKIHPSILVGWIFYICLFEKGGYCEAGGKSKKIIIKYTVYIFVYTCIL